MRASGGGGVWDKGGGLGRLCGIVVVGACVRACVLVVAVVCGMWERGGGRES